MRNRIQTGLLVVSGLCLAVACGGSDDKDDSDGGGGIVGSWEAENSAGMDGTAADLPLSLEAELSDDGTGTLSLTLTAAMIDFEVVYEVEWSEGDEGTYVWDLQCVSVDPNLLSCDDLDSGSFLCELDEQGDTLTCDADGQEITFVKK